MKLIPKFKFKLVWPRAKWLLPVLVLLLLLGSNLGSYFYGFRRGRVAANPSGRPDLSTFWKAWDAIDQNFYGSKDTNKRIEGAISGMVASLGDPYTLYLDPEENTAFREDIQGSFEGIGAELTLKNSLLTVVLALPGSPAEKVGLKADDVITQVDGKSTGGLNLQEAVNHIRGPKGSTVTLTVLRSGSAEPLTLKVTRDTIVLKSVETSSVGPGGSVAYIKVTTFGDDTSNLMQAALQAAKESGKKGLILDLRNNPGGLVDRAVEMVGMLIPSSVDSTDPHLRDRAVLLQKFEDGSQKELDSNTQPILTDIPMVVLVNGGSASASEIVAGALKEYKRASLVGSKTFGKGSVQDLVNMPDGGSVKVTIARWFTPLGQGFDGKGIQPDVSVDQPSDTAISSSDPQATKALEILQQSIK